MTIQELEQCISLYGKDIYSFCMHLAKESADDLYQDAFLEATKKIASIRYEDNPKSYLLSIVIRLWKNRVRKRAWRSRNAPQVAEKYFTQIEEQKDDENAAAQKETDEMAGNEQIEKRLDGAKLIESETKTVTPDEDGTFTYQAYRPAKAQLK